MAETGKKIMVVTGASSGIGREILMLLEQKERVDEIWAVARSEAKLQALQNVVKTRIVPLSLDLSNREDLKKYEQQLKEKNPEILILANCAGFGLFDHTENADSDILTNMVDLNCTSYVAMISSSLPYIPNGGKIMNIASCAAFQPIPYINCYAATKAFVLSYSRGLNQELRYRNIHVLAVTPFWTKTAFFDRAIDENKKPVVIKYAAMYDANRVAAKAVRDLYTEKEISCYGFVNNAQRILVRILPKKLVMKIWTSQQKLNGTPGIR